MEVVEKKKLYIRNEIAQVTEEDGKMVKQREWGRVSVKDTFYFKIRRSVERRDAHVNF